MTKPDPDRIETFRDALEAFANVAKQEEENHLRGVGGDRSRYHHLLVVEDTAVVVNQLFATRAGLAARLLEVGAEGKIAEPADYLPCVIEAVDAALQGDYLEGTGPPAFNQAEDFIEILQSMSFDFEYAHVHVTTLSKPELTDWATGGEAK